MEVMAGFIVGFDHDPRMDATRLIEGYKSLLQTIYSPREYYQRALECLKQVAPGRESKSRNPVRDLITLTRVILNWVCATTSVVSFGGTLAR
jgi:hypothetical protein